MPVKKTLIILLLTLSLCFSASAFADTVILKSGKTIEGKIVEKTDEYVKIDFMGVVLTYYIDQIESIATKEGPPLSAKEMPDRENLNSPDLSKQPRIIESPQYIIYIPEGIQSNKNYPLVMALSPSADANSMIRAWKNVSEKYKWIIWASKEIRNSPEPMNLVSDKLAGILQFLALNYQIDKTKVIMTGYSGGGMQSYSFSFHYPGLISAIVINTGMMDDYYINRVSSYPRRKIAVFLASPTDFRYNEMKRDHEFLDKLEWKTKWIEFTGGHVLAPDSAYQEATAWLAEQFQ